MEIQYFALLVGGLVALLIGVAIAKRSRHETQAEIYYGPLPEDEVERAEASGERSDPVHFEPRTSSADTPPSAGLGEERSDAIGVGQERPRYLDRPPRFASDGPTPSDMNGSGRTNDAGQTSDRESRQAWLRTASVAGGGAGAGLAVAVLLRRRARRHSRVERLRAQARRAAALANSAAASASDRAGSLHEAIPDKLAAKSGVGSGLVLVAVLGAFAALRRWQRETEARRLAAEAAAQAEAARERGRLGLKLGADWITRQRERVRGDFGLSDRLPKQVPSWAAPAGGLLFIVIGVATARRLLNREPEWSGAVVADSSPARDRPASP